MLIQNKDLPPPNIIHANHDKKQKMSKLDTHSHLNDSNEPLQATCYVLRSLLNALQVFLHLPRPASVPTPTPGILQGRSYEALYY